MADLVKKAYQKTRFSNTELLEFSKCANDPFHFLNNYFKIQHPTRGSILYNAYPFQNELLHSYHDFRFSISMLGRQMGKSTTAAGYLLWYAMFNPDQTILIAAHKYSGAQEIMHRIRYAYELCPDYIRAGATSYNKGSLEFDNGSRIIAQATTENTGRGLSISLLYCDEFAFVRPNIAKEFWTSISPTLATGGKAIITSTPNLDDDQFALIWSGANKKIDEYGNEKPIGINGFRPFKAIWDEHPDRNVEWSKEERTRVGEERFLREHECQFIAFDETLVDSIKLSHLKGKEPLHKTGQVRWYEKINKNSTYVIGLDPAMGTGGDYSAIEVWSLPELVQVAEWQSNRIDVRGQVKTMHDILTILNDEMRELGNNNPEIYWSVENNSLGEAALIVIEEMDEDKFPGEFLHEPKKRGIQKAIRKGFTTSYKTKITACMKLKSWMESDKMIPLSKNLIRELKTFIAKGKSFEAKLGETDDLVSATLLCIRQIQVISRFDEEYLETLGESLDGDDSYNDPLPVVF
jgi:hypothetical protein|tara:strand:+ start:95 stop:1654 length:1560 start_codon:yes stop_codon:yes gene_type:complete